MHYSDSLIFTGGDILKSSEMITENGQVLQGELLPVPLYFHAIASVNSTTSIISGGCTIHQMDCTSPLTFYYNHVTQVFTSGPSLNLGRNYHASGTIIDKITKEKFVVVTGGEINGWSEDSTEILVNQHWQEGKNLCEIKLKIQDLTYPNWESFHPH